MMTTTLPDHTTVRGETKLETPPSGRPGGLPSIPGNAVPLYPGSGQPPIENSFTPLREPRFPNSVWQPNAADPNALGGTWTPQGQFIQQLPPHQIDDLRYSQYSVAGYPQPTPVVGYQQGSFVQSNGTVYSSTGPQAQPSPHSLHNGNSRSTPTLNGNLDYIDQSPRPSEFINGTYHSSQDVMAPPTSSTPTSRCGSAQLESSTEGKYTNPPTPTTPSNQGNAMPGYPHQIPPQSPQSSLNSSGYPGQESASLKGEQKTTQNVWSRSSSTNSLHNDVEKSPSSSKDWLNQMDGNRQMVWKNNQDSFGRQSEWMADSSDNSKTPTKNTQKQESWSTKEENRSVEQSSEKWSPEASPSPITNQQEQQSPKQDSSGQAVNGNTHQFNNTQVQSNQVQQLQQQQQQQAQQQQQQQQAQQQQQIQQQQQQQAQQQQQQAQQQQQQQQQAQQQQQQQQQQQAQQQQQQQQQQAQQQQQQQAQQQQQQQAQQQAMQQQLKQQQLQQQHQQQQQQLQQQQQQLQQQQLNQQLQQHHQQLNQQLHQQQQKQQQLSQQLQLNQRLNQQIQQQQLNQQLQQHQQQLAQHQQMHQQQHTPQHSPHHTIQHSPHQQYQISQQQHQITQKQANLQTSQQQQEQSSQLQHQISQQQQHQLSPQQHQIPSQLQQHQISQQAQASAHQHQMAQQQHLLHQQQLAQQKQHLTHHLSQQQHISQQQKHLAQQAQHQQQYMFTHHPLAQHQQQHLIQHQQQKQLISQQQMKQSKQSQLNLHEVQQNPQQSIHNNRQNIWSNNGDGAPMANNSLSQQNVHLWANGSHTQQNSLWSSESNNVQQNQPEPWPNGQYQAGNQQQSQVPSSNWGGDKKNSKVQERAELNNRLKTMILNKQNQDSKKTDESQNQTIYEDQKNLQSVSSGNFLAKGHHPQKLVSEGGGTWGESPQKYNQSISAMENFVKYATSMGSPDLKQNWNEPTYSHASYQNSLNFERPQNGILFPTNQEQGRKVIQQEQRPHQPFPSWYPNYPMPYGYNHTSHIKYEALWYQKQEPWGTQTEFISRDLVNTSYIPKIPFGMDPRLDEPIEKIDEEDGVLKKMQAKYVYHGDGGPVSVQSSPGPWCCRQGGTDKPSAEHTKDGCCQGYQTQDEILESDKDIKNELDLSSKPSDMTVKEYVDYLERLRNNRTEIPNCQCFPPDQCPPEPGSYYTHLGSASSLEELRTNIESRSGLKGKAIRVEKIVYTGKEGKTTAGCPLAKWIIRRGSLDEKILLIVKNRKGHTCSTAWIVVVVVAWEGVATQEADSIYALLTSKLNKFGVPTTRRCATNEPRTCACQGLDMATCGSSYSFGCSWSMYYNGCKYARSKVVRKFRLSVRSEEQDIEDKMQKLATDLGPLYEKMAPDSYKNQIKFEKEAIACRLGLRPGRPFSGVTACFDFCAHAHRDAHNMNNGCTVVVTLTKHRTLSKPDDEQLHVLPLYIMDETDEYGNREGQLEKINNGSLESLSKYPCEVRVRAVPLTPCRKHGKKRKDEEEHQNQLNNGKNNSKEHSSQTSSDLLQSSQVSSTVIDSPVQSNQSCGGGYQNSRPNSVPNSLNSVKTTFSPHSQQFNNFQEKRPHSHHGEMSYGFETEVKTDPDSTTNHAQWEDRSPGCNISGRSSYFQLPSPNHQTHLPSPKGSNAVSPINNSEGSNREDKPYSISPCNSVFRVPKGRPPSRSNSSTPQPTIENSTYIKPLPAFPPLEHRFDRPNSPIRDWDNIPQSSQKSPRSSQYSNGILHHSPGSVNENNHDQSYKPQNSPGAGVKEQSQGTQTMKQSPNNYNQSCSNGVRRSPVPQQVAPNGGTSSQNFNSMFNNQFPSYPNLYNPSNGYIEYNNNHFNTGNPTYYPDHNYGSKPNYHYYENFSKANHNSAVQNANQLHPNEQTYQSNANGHVYPGQTDGLRNGFRNVNNNILPGKQKEINGNCFASSFEPYKGDRPVKPSTPHLLPNIKKENCQWQYCSSNPVSPGGPKNGIASPSGCRPPSSNAQQEVHIKREKDERSMSQCEHRFPDYPNGVFPNQTHPGPNAMPYARSPHWAHSLVSPPYIKEETEHILHPPFDPDFHANHLQSHPSLDYQGVGMYQLSGWDNYGPTPYLPMIKEVKPEPIGQVADFIDNEECFKDSQMGGVAIALSHGSVLFECAKHELHATTALHKPNRLQPTRISLVFYQHRNLNRPNHGANEWEEKMRLRKLGTSTSSTSSSIPNNASPPSPAVLRSPTYTTTTWTTLFPMHPCVGTGPYQKT